MKRVPNCKGVCAFTTGKPVLGTKLLGFSIGRGFRALKGLQGAPPFGKRLEPKSATSTVSTTSLSRRRLGLLWAVLSCSVV